MFWVSLGVGLVVVRFGSSPSSRRNKMTSPFIIANNQWLYMIGFQIHISVFLFGSDSSAYQSTGRSTQCLENFQQACRVLLEPPLTAHISCICLNFACVIGKKPGYPQFEPPWLTTPFQRAVYQFCDLPYIYIFVITNNYYSFS